MGFLAGLVLGAIGMFGAVVYSDYDHACREKRRIIIDRVSKESDDSEESDKKEED